MPNDRPFKRGDVVEYHPGNQPNTPAMDGAIGVVQGVNDMNPPSYRVAWLVCPDAKYQTEAINSWCEHNLHKKGEVDAI